jgi:hypothetical protein
MKHIFLFFSVSVLLIVSFSKTVFAALPGDANNDNRVDGQDYTRWLSRYNQNTANGPQDGDFNSSGKVDGIDYVIWLVNYGRTETPSPSTGTTPTSPPASGSGIWISTAELRNQPTSGVQWQAVYSLASGSLGTADVSNQDSNHDVNTLAAAIVCARTNEFCDKAKQGLLSAIGTESGARWLAIGRNLTAYTIAADLINLRSDGNPSSDGSRIQAWLTSFLTRQLANNNTGVPESVVPFGSGSNASAQEGAMYAAIAAYTKDTAKLNYVWNRFRLYSCDKVNNPETTIDIGTGISSGWTHDTNNPCAVNPKGTTKVAGGVSRRIDGAIINDMRRGGDFAWPPGYTSYPWVGLEGYVPAALILYRAGYPAFEVANKAVARTFEYLWYLKQETGNTDWFDGSRADETTHLINKYYGTNYPVQSAIGGGRTFGFTGYTHPTRESLLR